MKRTHTRAATEGDGINLTPLLDMVFILLIFFMVSATFTRDAGIEVSRPGAATGEPQAQTSLRVAITTSGDIWIDGRSVSQEVMQATLAELESTEPGTGVVIVADRDAPTWAVVAVTDAARLAGIASVSLATSSEG